MYKAHINTEQKQYAILGLWSVIIGFLGKVYYRDYIYSNKIYDWGIAGSLPSYFYVVGFSFLLLMRKFNYPVLIPLTVTFASALFEIKQYISSEKLDYKDIIASVAGGLTVVLIQILMKKFKP